MENIIFRVGYHHNRSNYLESVFDSGFYLQESEKDLSSRKFQPASLETYDIVSEFGTKIRGWENIQEVEKKIDLLKAHVDSGK